jgi:hypothetical protein
VGDVEYDWERTVYAGAREQIPHDAPKPLGRAVTTTTYKDANLMHDLLSGKSVTGLLHFVNQTPIDWYSKKQASTLSATYGTEFVAGGTAMNQIEDLRLTLRYLGVPIAGPSYLFGDNQSVITSSTLPLSRLKIRHIALNYHRVREMIASKAVRFLWIDGKENPADILTKHWGHHHIWDRLKSIMFWPGDTADLYIEKRKRKNELEKERRAKEKSTNSKTREPTKAEHRGV